MFQGRRDTLFSGKRDILHSGNDFFSGNWTTYHIGIGPLILLESDRLSSGIRDILWETGYGKWDTLSSGKQPLGNREFGRLGTTITMVPSNPKPDCYHGKYTYSFDVTGIKLDIWGVEGPDHIKNQ